LSILKNEAQGYKFGSGNAEVGIGMIKLQISNFEIGGSIKISPRIDTEEHGTIFSAKFG
jgi:hypothetical protein